MTTAETTLGAPVPVGSTHAEAPDELRVFVNRPVYDYPTFNANFHEETGENLTFCESLGDQISKRCCDCDSCSCSCGDCRDRCCSWIPLFSVFKSCTCSDVFADLIAGITMALIHIPQGLAYGMLVGISPIYGLYSSFIPAFLFAFFSTSRHLSIGTFALMSILLSDVLERHYGGYLGYMLSNNRTFPVTSNHTGSIPDGSPEAAYVRLQLVIMATFICALINLLLGSVRLGQVAVRLLSGAMVRGFTTAVAFHVVTVLVPYLLGVEPAKNPTIFRIAGAYIEIFRVITHTNWITVVTCVVCVVLLCLGKEALSPLLQEKLRIPLPVELFVLVGGLLFSYFTSASTRFGMDVVGEITPGFPAPIVPDFHYMPYLILDTILLAIIGATVTVSIARTYALEYDYQIDVNQEFVSLGLANILGSFFQSFYAVGALARTSVVASTGMTSQMASLISCGVLVLVVVFLGPFFSSVPQCVLAVIIIMSLKHLFLQAKELPTIWKISRLDFFIWIATFLIVIVFDIIPGLIVGFLLSIFSFVLRNQRPQFQVLGRMDDTEVYQDIKFYNSAKEVPGIKIIRYEGPIAFLNADLFKDVVLEEVNSQRHRAVHIPFHTVIFDGSSWSYIDSAGVKVIGEVYRNLVKRDFRVLFSCANKAARSRFLASNVYREIQENLFFPTTEDAVLFAVSDPRDRVGDGAWTGVPLESKPYAFAVADEKQPLLATGSGKHYL